ncbi:MAG: HlyC/CorC family transporter [Acidiferrobacterales bacterium]
MYSIPISVLTGLLVFLILLSAFFSASEIAVMSINRYRLKHLADGGNSAAIKISRLLEHPDRLLGVILLGNNLVNNSAAAIATLLAIRLYGESAIYASTVMLTIVILIFAEVGPKTLAVINPEKVAFPAAFILKPLQTVSYPVTWLINIIANQMLRIVGVSLKQRTHELSGDELRVAVKEAGALIPKSHQTMLLGILDLEKTTVEDVMVPRNRIQGIDLDQEWDSVVDQIMNSRYTRLPVYHGSLDNIVGTLHLRKALNLAGSKNLTAEALKKIIAEPYFIPKGTPLNTQLLNFRSARKRRGLVVNEYGDILGLVALEEILEEIVGEFTVGALGISDDFRIQDDGSYMVKGSASLRDLNRRLGWHLPIEESKTLNGLITEYLETIPETGTSIMLSGYTVDIIRTKGTAIEIARVIPLRRKEDNLSDTGESKDNKDSGD